MEKIITTQEELNALPLDFKGIIYIEGGTRENPLILKVNFQYATVIARGSCFMKLYEVGKLSGVSGNATISRVWDNATISGVSGNATISGVSGNATISINGEAMVSAISAKKIICNGYNVVQVRKSNKKKCNIVLNKTSTLVVIPDFKPTFAEFVKRYPVKVEGKNAILYKAVHKKDDKYYSDNDKSFIYEIGKEYTHVCAPKEKGSCAEGLHIAFLDWAIRYGLNWNDMALLECEVPIKSIVVSEDCDGKVRCSCLKVIREIPRQEWYN